MLTERRPEANGGGEASLRWINNFLGETAYREFEFTLNITFGLIYF